MKYVKIILITAVIILITTANINASEIFAKNTKHFSLSSDISGKYRIGIGYELNYSSMIEVTAEYDSYKKTKNNMEETYTFYKADVDYNYLITNKYNFFFNSGVGLFYENARYEDINNVTAQKNGYGLKINGRVDYQLPFYSSMSVFLQDNIKYYLRNTYYEGLKNNILIGISYHY